MTQQEVMEWMETYLDGTMPEKSALGMIKQDIKEYGFDTFLEMPPETIIQSSIEISEEVTIDLVNDFRALFDQERQIEDLGLEQSMRIDPGDSMMALRNGMSDIMQSMLLYVDVQRMANTLIEEDEN
jgi:hypothetical protein